MNLRSFIAVEIPAEIHRAITRSTASLQKALPTPLVRWVEPQNIHLTLIFLGDVSPVNLELLAEALKVELTSHESFSMSVGGLGAFPSSHRPRIVWVGLEAPAALTTLQHGVETVAARIGYIPEERPFSPHLTIGRVGQSLTRIDLARIKAALEATSVGRLGIVHVGAVHIF
jgi:2'-5' RNA ligase